MPQVSEKLIDLHEDCILQHSVKYPSGDNTMYDSIMITVFSLY